MTYDRQPARCFWRQCQKDEGFMLDDLYAPHVKVERGLHIATAGSCFAQKLGSLLNQTDAKFLDLEPLPIGMKPETGRRYGYGLYSARYGNIYTSAQLLQLAEDAFSGRLRPEAIWQQGSRWYDGLRPRIEPDGFEGRDDLETARKSHLRKVKQLLMTTDVFIFTLGLTERWQHTETGTVFPIWPGAFPEAKTDDKHVFVNARVTDVVNDLDSFINLVRSYNPEFRVIFTVSPVPLAATATSEHVLTATVRSKAVLRTAVDEILQLHEGVDYFPAFEIATANPRMRIAFEADERQVRRDVVDKILGVFLSSQTGMSLINKSMASNSRDPVCEEVLLQSASS